MLKVTDTVVISLITKTSMKYSNREYYLYSEDHAYGKWYSFMQYSYLLIIMSTGSAPHLQMSPKRFTMATNRQYTMVTTNAFIIFL